MKILMAFLMLILIGLQYRLWVGEGSVAEISVLEAKISEQAAINAELEARNLLLIQEVEDLKTGMDSIEERARSDLGLIKKGETFYMIVEDEGKD